jgi:hypothetical protein
MRLSLERSELALAAFAACLLLVALFAPALAQPPYANSFADHRGLWGLANALDVLSNVPFAVAGVWGLMRLRKAGVSTPAYERPAAAVSAGERAAMGLFFIGLIVTAFGSCWYHLAPDDAGLAVDRASMSVAFAGLLALVAASNVSERAGRALGIALLVLGPLSVLAWFRTGNVLPWALVQFGGIPLLALFALRGPRRGGLAVRWGLVLLAYALAKLCEMNDFAVFAATGQLFSGHTLKHLVAAFAAWPVLQALAGRQNAPRGTAAWAPVRRA